MGCSSKIRFILSSYYSFIKGLTRLNSVYKDTPSFSTKESQQDVGFKLEHVSNWSIISQILYLLIVIMIIMIIIRIIEDIMTVPYYKICKFEEFCLKHLGLEKSRFFFFLPRTKLDSLIA